MAKREKAAPVPEWLKPTLKRAITGEPQPDTMDYQVIGSALAGVELEALKSRFDLSTEEIHRSLLRVACAVRSGTVDAVTMEANPDLAALRPKTSKAKKTGPRSMADESLDVIDVSDLPEIISGNDESFHAFLMAAKVKYARRIVPATFKALERNLGSLDGMVSNPAIAKSLEMYHGVGRRGPGVAMQFNMAGGQPQGKSEVTPHFFEQTILEAEKADGSSGGEAHVFDERLLGQQEEG